jgi:hypothetical protein
MRIALFSPFNEIWIWGLFLSYFGLAFKSENHQIDFITCDRTVDYCTAMLARGLEPSSPDETKEKLCQLCSQKSRWLAKGFNFDQVSLKTYLSKNVAMGSIDNDSATRMMNFAFYETVLKYKRYQDLDSDMVIFQSVMYEGCKNVFSACEAYLQQKQPDMSFVWNGLYAYNQTWGLAAARHNVPVYWIHAGANRGFEFRSIMFGTQDWYSYNAAQKVRWKELGSHFLISKLEANLIASHLENVIKGKTPFTYSRPRQSSSYKTARHIGEKKLIVLTTSSRDELEAAKSSGAKALCRCAFVDQPEWIRFVLHYFEKLDGYHLVLRVHPREFPNHRESMFSESSKFYLQLRDEYKNCNSIHINLPDDNISLYDLFEEADIILNAWSSAGEEAGLLGIPVLSAFQGYCNYPDNLEPQYSDRTEYLQAVHNEINGGWDPNRALRFLKWRVFSTLRSEISFNNEYSELDASGVPILGHIKRRLQAIKMIRRIKRENTDKIDMFFGMNSITQKNKKAIETDESSLLNYYFKLIYEGIYSSSYPILSGTLQERILKYISNT